MAKFPIVSDYQVLIMPQSISSVIAKSRAALPSQSPVTRPAEDFDELTKAQQRSFQAKIIMYQMKNK